MFRPASNCLLRGTSLRSLSRTSASTVAASRRFLSTAPPAQKSRSWKSAAVRWGLAGAAVYYYNTSNVFAEEPAYIHSPPEAHQDAETTLTLDSIAKRKQQRDAATSPLDAKVVDQTETIGALGEGGAAPGSPEELEAEAGQEGAFNPETGEINWDCPCLGGMANGPCGEEFKAAFSCFVYSTDEPKGVDCIDKFKGMQDCFRLHPDIYGAELDDDDEEGVDVEGVSGSPQDGSSSGPSVDEPSVAPPNPSSNPSVDEPSVAPSRHSAAQADQIPALKTQDQPDSTESTPKADITAVQELKNEKPRAS